MTSITGNFQLEKDVNAGAESWRSGICKEAGQHELETPNPKIEITQTALSESPHVTEEELKPKTSKSSCNKLLEVTGRNCHMHSCKGSDQRLMEETIRVIPAAVPKFKYSASGGSLVEQLKKIDLSADGGTLKFSNRSLSESGE
jgi:hypothetical protein